MIGSFTSSRGSGSRWLGAFAALACLSAVVGFGAALDGYSHLHHPVSLPGAVGMPHALAFNLLAFVAPGALAAWVALRLRALVPQEAGWSARIGASLWLLSALAFVAQGVLALDGGDLDAPASRLHAVCWTLWWLAFVPGAGLLALGLRKVVAWRGFALLCAVAALVTLTLLSLPSVLGFSPLAQRFALAAWWLCFALAARRA